MNKVILACILSVILSGCGLYHRASNRSHAAKISPGMTKEQVVAIMGNPEIYKKAKADGEPVEDLQYWTNWSVEGQTMLYTHYIVKDNIVIGYYEDTYTGPVITTLGDSIGRFGQTVKQSLDKVNDGVRRDREALRDAQRRNVTPPRGVVDENGRWYQIVY